MEPYMKRLQVCYLFTLSLALGDTANLLGQQIQFIQIDYQFADGSKADNSEARGINRRGDIVGTYVKAGVNHGFLLSGGHFSTIDYHDADSTFADSINASGDIVGSYVVAGVTHGFLLRGGTYSTVELSPYVPGARAVKSSASATTVISSATTA